MDNKTKNERKTKTKSQFIVFDITCHHRLYHLIIYFRFDGPQIIGIVFTVVSFTCDDDNNECSSSVVVNVKPLVNEGNSPKSKDFK
jgi:hypothetical protein